MDQAALNVKSISLGIELPAAIQEFYKVQDGLLADGNGVLGIKPLQQLVRLSEYAYFDEYDDQISYECENYLVFSGDGVGNARCFDLTQPIGRGDYLTVDWDHETRELTHPMSFWRYLKDFSITELW